MSEQLAEARALLLAEKKARADACWTAMQALLEKHRCDLAAVPVFVPGGGTFAVAVQIRVSARED